MSALYPCPICGHAEGYALADGSTFRWWRVTCAHCGAEVTECRADGTTRINEPKPQSWPWADEAWNEAGAHAQGLRRRLEVAQRLADALENLRLAVVRYLPEYQEPAREIQSADAALAEWKALQ